MKVVGLGGGPILGNLGRERDSVANFDGAEDGGRGRVDHDASRDGWTIGIRIGEPECRRPLGGDKLGKMRNE